MNLLKKLKNSVLHVHIFMTRHISENSIWT